MEGHSPLVSTATVLTGCATFESLALSPAVLRALSEMGYVEPTPIQAEIIPLMLGGRDVVGQAQTGTGKTAAFGIPIAERLDPALRVVQAIVLVPTRELCLQVSKELQRIARYRDLAVVAIYGGAALGPQAEALERGAQIVVGTPGRVMDHMRRGVLLLDTVRIAVLDEADEMLDVGFADDMQEILRWTPRARQTALFSATVPPFVDRLIRRYLREPAWVRIAPEMPTVEAINQLYYLVAEAEKMGALATLLDEWGPQARVLVFRRTQVGVDRLADALRRAGYRVRALHGGMSQADRLRTLQSFRDGSLPILVATNVAARGLDIVDITHVVNYDMPQTVEEYIHRIGRTGRAGREGTAVLLVGEWDFPMLDAIMEQMDVWRELLPGQAV